MVVDLPSKRPATAYGPAPEQTGAVHLQLGAPDQLGDVAELTNGYQAPFIGAAGIAVAAALAALRLLRTSSGTAAEMQEEETAAEPAAEALAA